MFLLIQDFLNSEVFCLRISGAFQPGIELSLVFLECFFTVKTCNSILQSILEFEQQIN